MAKPWPILLMVRELDIGGCERDLTKVAIGIDRTRFEPHVGCFRPDGFRAQELKSHGIPVVHVPVQSFRSRSAVYGARVMGEYIRAHDIQLMHSYDVPTTVFGVPVARMYGCPVVISSQLSYRQLAKPFVRRLLRVTDRMVDTVVVNCVAMQDHMVNDEKVAAERTYLCYNGVDTRVFYPAEEPAPQPLADASLVIGAVCGLRAEKRLDLLVDAFARVYSLRANMKLAIVGSGVMLEPLERQATELGIRHACVFEPATSNVPPWLRAMDIFVLSSDSEAFSNALLEAMASGCCPVGSRVGGTPELIEHGKHGFLFESGNSQELASHLAELITHDELRLRFASAAVCFAREKLSVEINVARMSGLYAQSIERSISKELPVHS
jgi:glycosyltransferase involved in cell wall biosynthesis